MTLCILRWLQSLVKPDLHRMADKVLTLISSPDRQIFVVALGRSPVAGCDSFPAHDLVCPASTGRSMSEALTSAYLDPIPGVIPFKTLTVFAGAPGIGKTATLADWIQRWRHGRDIWGHATNPPNQFAYLAGDRHWESHAQWFRKVGFPDIPHYSIVDDRAFSLDEFSNSAGALDLLKRSLDRAADGYPPVPGAHVFIDPAVPLFIAGSQNDPRAVAKSLVAMSREAEQRNINITLVAHFGKQKGDGKDKYTRPQDRIAGSYAFSGFSDTQIYLVGPEEQQPYHILGWNPRHSHPQDFACQRDDKTGLFIPYDVMRDDATAAEVSDCFDATGPTTINVIRERALLKGHSKATVHRILDRLIKDGRLARIGRGRYQLRRLN